MTDLIYPTLDLFLYDLRNGLGDNEAEISDRRQQFLKKVPESLHQTICNNDNDFETEYTELIPQSKVKKFETIRESNSLAGYYYPVRIGDSYGLLVDCSVENQTYPQPAECFKELKQEIEQNQLKGELANIGQTWMISGWMPQGTDKSPEEIATACYQSLIPEGNWQQDIDGKGKFLAADIFELSRYRLVIKQGQSVASSIQDVQNSWHIIIIIYPDRETAEKAANFYFEWMPLFVYRHKILWCYGQSRLIKQSIKQYFSTIEDQQKIIESELKTGRNLASSAKLLRQIQNLLNNYAIDLNRLEFQSSTIDINLSNYQKRWQRIEAKARTKGSELPESSTGENDLSFLDKFGQLVNDKYQLQIHKDRDNLERGQKLMVNIINAVRTRVEVEKADRDRQFQDLITILGVGWAAGSFVQKNQGEIQTNNLMNLEVFVTSYITPLIYPVSVAIIVAVLTGWIKSLCDRSDFFSRIFGLLIGKVGKK